MTDDLQGRQSAAPDPRAAGRTPGRRRIVLAVAAILLLFLAVFFVPPMVSIGKYRARITRLISTSLGRPVRLSSVELRLLPRPGFVITDLSVAEDPAYGAEPVLHANSVTASIRLLSLWRGGLVIDSISVDEASLNVVHAGPGRWNLDPLFRTAAKAGSLGGGQRAAGAPPLPYLEATNSRINIKDGAEKLPFSLVNTDFEFWQPDPGDWRIRLRGQPARTDVNLSLEDTGEVRLEASAHRAPQLSTMPVSLDLDWRQAQLGQLSRLLIGSDPGWRGDLTGNLHLEGTADAAHVTTRLRATGVHRAEFAPAEPLDFDANCAFLYHYRQRSIEDIDCNSPLGDGHIQLTGDLSPDAAPNAKPSNLTLALDRISVGAGLDLLRTVRDGLAPDLTAAGAISGKLVYSATHGSPAVSAPRRKAHSRSAPLPPSESGPLTGSLTVEGFQLSGGSLTQPIHAAKVVLQPVILPGSASGRAESLAGSMSVPAGGPVPLAIAFRLAPLSYQVDLRGPVSLARARELASTAGFSAPAGFDGLAGAPVTLDLTAAGPWIAPDEEPAKPDGQDPDTLTGTLILHDANWHADFLARPLMLARATLHLAAGHLLWDPVAFTYGPVQGTATFNLPTDCPGLDPCLPQFQLQFGELDAARLQEAILGVHESEESSLLSSLIDRLHPSSAPPWPRLLGTIKAGSLVLGPVTLRQPVAVVRIAPDGAQITSLDAGLLGGQLQLSGSLQKPATDQDKPSYQFQGSFQKINPSALGQLIGLRWSGSPLSGSGTLNFSGYTVADLAATAKGSFHYDCQHGAITPPAASRATFPPALARFDRWTADAAIAHGAIVLGRNQVDQAGRARSVQATLTFAEHPRLAFSLPAASPPSRPKSQNK